MRRAAAAAACLALAVGLGACGGDDDDDGGNKADKGQRNLGTMTGESAPIQDLPDVVGNVPAPSAETRAKMTSSELKGLKKAIRTIDRSCKGGKASKNGSYQIALVLDGMLGLLRFKPDSPYSGTTVRAVAKQKGQQLKDCAPEQAARVNREFGSS